MIRVRHPGPAVRVWILAVVWFLAGVFVGGTAGVILCG